MFGTASSNTFPDLSIRSVDPVRSIMSSPVATIEVDASVRNAAEEMLRNDIGVVLVTDGARTGLLSERDLVAVLDSLVDVTTTQIGDLTTWDLVWAAPDDSVVEVAALMIEANVRHIPIGDGQTTVGIVSVRDVLAVFVRETVGRDRRALGFSAGLDPDI